MPDYLQDAESKYTQELIDAKIVAPNGEVLDTYKYIKLLRAHEEHIREQIQKIPEPGDIYDRYKANLLYKEIDVIRGMILRHTDSPSQSREDEIIERQERNINNKNKFIISIKKMFGLSR